MNNIKNCGIPILVVPEMPHDVVVKINNHTAKLNVDDVVRTDRIIRHCSDHIDLRPLGDILHGRDAD